MNEFRDRIINIIEDNGINKLRFAETLNISSAYVSKMLNKGSIPSDRLIEDICEKFNVNEEWLRTGNGKKTATPTDEYIDATVQIDKYDPEAKEFIIRYARLPLDARKQVANCMDLLLTGIESKDKSNSIHSDN